MTETDDTHDAARQSFVQSANGHPEFPIQNLPLGIFSFRGEERRGGVAIGNSILDLGAALAAGIFTGEAARAAEVASGPTLNAFFALGREARCALRNRPSQLLTVGCPEQPNVERLLYSADDCTMDVPALVGDYTDFYVGIHHAMNVGRQFRPDNPLLPKVRTRYPGLGIPAAGPVSVQKLRDDNFALGCDPGGIGAVSHSPDGPTSW
jgi:fumarylacetoacetase